MSLFVLRFGRARLLFHFLKDLRLIEERTTSSMTWLSIAFLVFSHHKDVQEDLDLVLEYWALVRGAFALFLWGFRMKGLVEYTKPRQ